jgi:hypothetical protein
MATDFDPDLHGEMFEASFIGYEEEQDVSELSGAYASLVSSGILGVTQAGKLLKLPDDPNAPYIGRILMTQTGPIFLDDMASDKMRNAAMQAQLSTFASAGQPKTAPKPQQQSEQQDNAKSEDSAEKDDTSTANQDDSENDQQQRQMQSSDLYELDDDPEDEIVASDDDDEQDDEDVEDDDPEDAEWEEEIAQLLKSDESEPFTLLERHSPGGHSHDQKTHGDGSHPAYGAKHDKSPEARQAMAAAAQLQPKIQAAEDKVQAAKIALIKASVANKPAAQAALSKAQADATALKVQAKAAAAAEKAKAQQEARDAHVKLLEQKAKAKAKAAKLATQKKSVAAKASATKAKGHIQKQATAAKAKTTKMAANAQQKAQVAAAKAAKSTAQSTKSQAHVALQQAKTQQRAAKTLQSLTNTIGAKAQLYNALSARKISKTWTAQDAANAQAIATDLHSLMNAVNSHQNEQDAASLMEHLTSAIGTLQGAKGVTQARASVLEKLAQKAQSQMQRSVASDDKDRLLAEGEQWFDGDEEWTNDYEDNETAGDTEKRYTISEILQLFAQQRQIEAAIERTGAHLEQSGEITVVKETDDATDSAPITTAQRDATQDYRKWRSRAIDDVKASRSQRGFTTTLIPEHIHQWISDELATCVTPDDVRTVFSRAREMESEPIITSKDELTKSVYSVFSKMAQRGHSELAIMEGE